MNSVCLAEKQPKHGSESKLESIINPEFISFTASDKIGGDGDIGSVMGFSGFGMWSLV